MGVVYLAQQKDPVFRRIALKIIKRGMDTREVLARFQIERQALALLNHPHIARIFDAGTTEDGRPYFVMDHVPGVAITSYCDLNRLTTSERLQLFVPVCEAIHHAHQRGIIHRDLKPSNILIATQDGRPYPKVIDFGVAKATGPRLTEQTVYTRQGVLIGTPDYMSPEQANLSALDIDTTSDVYSLGVVLYELLVGALPFDPVALREAGFEGMRKILAEEEPPRPSSHLHAEDLASARLRHTTPAGLLRELRGDLDWIVMKSLEKDRARRYASASEFAADITRHLNNEPVVAARPGFGYRLGKLVRRHRVAAYAVLAVLLAIAIGFTSTTILYFRATTARLDEEQQRIRAEHQSYVANIIAADSLLERGELALARRSLAACSPEQRGWEWKHLYLRAFPSHTVDDRYEYGSPLTMSPDGSSIVSSFRDGTARLWDTESGQVRITLTESDAWITVALFSPSGDRAAFAYSTGAVRVVNARSGELVAEQSWPGQHVTSLTFFPDETRLVLNSSTTDLQVWSLDSNRLMRVETGHNADITAVAVGPRMRRLVTASLDGTARLWDVDSVSLVATLAEHRGTVSTVAFDPRGDILLTGSNDGYLRLWDTQSGRFLAGVALEDGHILAASFNPDGTRAFAVSAGRRLWTWEQSSWPNPAPEFTAITQADDWLLPERPVELSAISLRTPRASPLVGNVRDWHFSGFANRIMIHHGARRVSVWDGVSATKIGTFREASAIGSLASDAEGRRLAVGLFDGAILFYNRKTTRPSLSLVGVGTSCQVSVSLDGTRIATADREYLAIWDAISGSGIASRRDQEVIQVASDTLSDTRAILSRRQTMTGWEVWDATAGTLLFPWDNGKPLAVSFGDEGRRVVSISNRGVQYWDVDAESLLMEMGPTRDIGISADGRHIVTVRVVRDRPMEVVVWDTATGNIGVSFEERDVQRAIISSDGSRVAGILPSGTVRVWNARSGIRIADLSVPASLDRTSRSAVTPFVGRSPYCRNPLAFSPDNERLVSALDNTVWVSNATTGDALLALRGHTGGVQSVAFSPTGTHIVSSSADGVRIWKARVGDNPSSTEGSEAN